VAAARVESASGTQVTDLGREMGVRGPLRNAIAVLAQGLRPALFPERSVVLDQTFSRVRVQLSQPGDRRRR
jgi:hypothetical protein